MTLWIRDFKAKSGRDLGMKVRTGIGMPVTESTPDNSNLALTPNNRFSMDLRLDYQPQFGKMSPHSSSLSLRRGSKTGPGRWRKLSLMDFLRTFTIILPSVTRTLDNSNLPLTRSNFRFFSDHSYINSPSITRTIEINAGSRP